MSNEIDYEADLAIDPDALDVEWLEQASRYMKYCRLSAQADDRVRRAEEHLKVIRSEFILAAHERTEEILGKSIKPTAQVVEAYYRDHVRHQEAKKDLFEAQEEADMLKAATFAMTHRRAALENLAKLVQIEYTAGPREPRDLSIEAGKRHRERSVMEKIKTSGRRKRRRKED